MLLLTIAVVLSFGACNRNNPTPEPGPGGMDDIKTGPSFSWQTTKSASFKITALDNVGNKIKGARFTIYTADPDSSDGKLIVSGITNSNGVYEIDYNVPAYYSELFVSSNYVGIPSPGTVKLEDGGFNIVLGGEASTNNLKSVLQPKATNVIYKFLGGYDSQGVPDYLEPTNDVIGQDLLDDINNSLPERVRLPQYHPEYFSLDYDHNIKLIETCDVWVTFVHEGAGYRNVLGFYTYDSDNPPTSPDDIDSITIIFPNASYLNYGGGLVPGNKVKLGQFNAGTTIGFALMANGWQNGEVTDGKWTVYSTRELNSANNPDLKQQTVLLYDNARELLLLGIEDIKRDASWCDEDFNDAVFYCTANPIEAIDQSALPPIDYTGTDTDGDGVPDNLDDYPDDPDMAFNNFYFNQGNFGSLVFEDLWPDKGDYDFNDAVIDYNFNQITNANNEMIQIDASFILRAHGAFYHNGFGFEIPIDNQLVEEVTGDLSMNTGIIDLDQRNMENGQTNAVIMVWDDAYQVLPQQFEGVGVNTNPDVGFVVPDTLNIHVKLIQAVSLTQSGIPPYNPFIFVNGNRSVEVHLADKSPTDLFDTNLFGTGADNSIPAEGRYFKTSNNLPWAINIIESFDYPVEKADITTAYLKFKEWAESEGNLYPDWWHDQAGYRNDENIYTPSEE